MTTADGVLLEKGLTKGTNWWGAFVIGLAGTILVTGIAPYVVQGTGARPLARGSRRSVHQR